MPTVAELIFKIQQQGLSELEKVDAVVKTVGEGTRLAGAQLKTFDATLQSLVGTGKTYRQALEQMAQSNGVLSQSVRGTAAELLLQMRAAEGDEAAIRKLAAATGQLAAANTHAVSQIAAVSGELRVLEGAMPIRAVENLLVKTLGLGSVFQAAFPIFGAIALGEVLVHVGEKVSELYQKWDLVAAAEKRAKDAATEYGNTVEGVKNKLQSGENEIFGLINGRPALLAREASQAAERSQQQEMAARNLEAVIKEAEDRAEAATRKLTSHGQSVMGGFAGPINTNGPERDLEEAVADADNARTLQQEFRNKAREEQNTATAKSIQSRQAFTQQDKHEFKTGDSAAKRGAEELLALQNKLSELTAKELGPLAEINAKHDAEVKSLQEKARLGEITKASLNEQLAVLKLITDEQSKQANERIFGAGIAAGRRALGPNSHEPPSFVPGILGTARNDSDRQFSDSLNGSDLERSNRKDLQVLGVYDQADADAQRRQFQKASAVAGLTGGDPNSTYQRRLELAKQIDAIQQRAIDRMEDGDDKDLAIAKAKYALIKEQDDAEVDHQMELLRLQKQRQDEAKQAADAQAQRDKQIASELANIAMSRNPSQGMHNFFRDQGHQLASGVAGNMFGNVVGGVLNPLSSAVNSAGLGDLFKGTILDRTKGDAASKTADNTLRTAIATEKMAGSDQSGSPVSNPAPAGGSAASIGSGSGILGSLRNLFGVSNVFSGNGYSSPTGDPSGSSQYLNSAAAQANFPLTDAGPTTAFSAGAPVASGRTAGGMIADAAAVAGGAIAAYQGFKKGGVSGDMQGVGGAIDSAAGILALTGVGAPIAAAVGAIGGLVGMVGSLFGTSPQQRANQIFNELGQSQYFAPTAWNVSQTGNGNYADFDARGNLRTSGFSAVPTVSEPYGTTTDINGQRQYYGVPGNTIAPFSPAKPAAQAAATTTINIQAMDAASFGDWLQRPGPNAALGHGVITHLQNSGERLADAIKYHMGG